MNELPELPPLGVALGFVLFGAPLTVLALRHAGRVLVPRPRPAHRWPNGEAAAIVALPFVVAGLFAILLGSAEGEEAAEPDVLLALFVSQLMLGSAGFLAAVLAARRTNGLASLGIDQSPPPRFARTILLVYLPGFFCINGLGLAWMHVCRAYGWEEKQEMLRLIFGLERHELLIAAFVAVLVGPFFEELLFRGFLQSFMAQVVGERWALVCSSALFARLHGMPGLPSLFLLSLFLGWLQLRTRSLWAPTLAHALNNAVTLALPLALGGDVEGLP